MITNRMQIAAMDRAGEVCAAAEGAQEVAAVRAPVAVATGDAERAKFEAFMSLSRRGQGAKKAERLLNKFPDGTYVEESVQRHWWTWQQALAVQLGGEGLPEAVLDDLWYLAEQTGLGNMSSRLRAHEFAKLICRAARAALPIDFKQATDQGGWVSVKDQLPASTHHVLACNACGYVGRAQWDGRHWNHIGKPTHWMPLPAAPTLLGVADGDAVGGKSGGQS